MSKSHSIGLLLAAAVAVGCVGIGKKDSMPKPPGSITGAEQTGLINTALNALSNNSFAIPAGFMSFMFFQTWMHGRDKKRSSASTDKLIEVIHCVLDQSNQRELARIQKGTA